MGQSARIAAAIAFMFVGSTAHAGAPDSTDRRNFMEKQTGRVAVYPRARQREDVARAIQFNYFPKNGEYELHATQSVLWFGIDHQFRPDMEEAKAGSKPAFLAVQIIAEYSSPPSAAVYLYRDAGLEETGGWVRDDDSGFNGTEPWKKTSSHPIADFFKFQADPSTSEEFDTTFGKWHAQPAAKEDSSWKYRSNWISSNLPSDGNVLLENYLYRFTPTGSASHGPVPFYTNVSNVRRARIRTFAPGFKPGLFDNDIIINFK